MLIVARFQYRIYSTVNRFKIFWYNLLFLLLLFQFLFSWKCTLWLINWVRNENQTVPYYVNHLMTKVVIIDINCNPLVELESILLVCRGVLFCISSEISFRYFSRSRSSPLNRFTKHSLRNWMKSFGRLRMKCFRSLRENFWNIGRIETIVYSSS